MQTIEEINKNLKIMIEEFEHLRMDNEQLRKELSYAQTFRICWLKLKEYTNNNPTSQDILNKIEELET